MSSMVIPTTVAIYVFACPGEQDSFLAMVYAAFQEMKAAQLVEPVRPMAEMDGFKASNGVKVGIIMRDVRL